LLVAACGAGNGSELRDHPHNGTACSIRGTSNTFCAVPQEKCNLCDFHLKVTKVGRVTASSRSCGVRRRWVWVQRFDRPPAPTLTSIAKIIILSGYSARRRQGQCTNSKFTENVQTVGGVQWTERPLSLNS
jgi:hypothetical protein